MERITPDQIDIICDLYVEIHGTEPAADTLNKIGGRTQDWANDKIRELEARKAWLLKYGVMNYKIRKYIKKKVLGEAS